MVTLSGTNRSFGTPTGWRVFLCATGKAVVMKGHGKQEEKDIYFVVFNDST